VCEYLFKSKVDLNITHIEAIEIRVGGIIVSVSMRLKRFGSKKRPYYRIVVMDSRSANKSTTLAEVGQYHPVENKEEQVVLDVPAVKDWLVKGAQPSATVRALLNKQGVQVSRTNQE
jgi:small subunit ribosomal protein S16